MVEMLWALKPFIIFNYAQPAICAGRDEMIETVVSKLSSDTCSNSGGGSI